MLRFCIRTNWTNSVSKTYKFGLDGLAAGAALEGGNDGTSETCRLATRPAAARLAHLDFADNTGILAANRPLRVRRPQLRMGTRPHARSRPVGRLLVPGSGCGAGVLAGDSRMARGSPTVPLGVSGMARRFGSRHHGKSDRAWRPPHVGGRHAGRDHPAATGWAVVVRNGRLRGDLLGETRPPLPRATVRRTPRPDPGPGLRSVEYRRHVRGESLQEP